MKLIKARKKKMRDIVFFTTLIPKREMNSGKVGRIIKPEDYKRVGHPTKRSIKGLGLAKPVICIANV